MKFLNNRRRRGSVALAAGAALVLAACGSGSESGGEVEEIKILVSAPLTGESAETGNDLVDGAQLAADYLNEQGGVKSGPLEGKEFVIESTDDQLETEAATTIASRFAGEDDLFALTGFLTSGQAQAAGVVLQRYELPAVVSFASADFLTSEADNLVVVSAAVSNFAKVAGDFASESLGASTVGSIAGDYSFLDSYYSGLNAALEENGAENVSEETYAEGTADFATLLTRIDSSDPDVVMSGAFQSDAGKIASQMRSSGMDQPFVDFLGEGWGETFSEAAGSALQDGDFYQMDPADVFPEEGSLLAEMNERFQEDYNKSIPTASMHSFDSVLTIAAAIEAGAASKSDLLDFIPEVEGDGLLGPIGFTEDLTPVERFGTMSRITGPNPEDREQAASYIMQADGTVEETDASQ